MKMSEKNNMPQFFKILKGDFSKRLRIPPAFVKHLPARSKRATLKGPGGVTSVVHLCRSVNGSLTEIYFQDGWPEFVKDHSLEDSNFLLFRYDGKMLFDVRIFDKTACEREESIYNTFDKSTINKRRKNSLPEKTALNLRSQHRQISPEIDTRNHQSNFHGLDTPEPEYKDTSAKIKHEFCSKRISHRLKKHQPEPDPIALKRALSFGNSLTSPYYLMTIKKYCLSKPYIMQIPVRFAKKHLPESKSRFTIRDPNGKAWKVTFLPRQYSPCIYGGLSEFVRANDLKLGHICLFEVLGESKMRVHIYK